MNKMIEINDDIICRLMAGYPKQPILICEPGVEPVSHYLEGVDFYLSRIIAERVRYDPKWIKLILRPLDKITFDDARACAQIIMANRDVGDDMVIKVRSRLREETFKGGVASMNYIIRTFQYLQNKGYDLPHYLLGNKTLKEAGLAIYL